MSPPIQTLAMGWPLARGWATGLVSGLLKVWLSGLLLGVGFRLGLRWQMAHCWAKGSHSRRFRSAIAQPG